MKQKPTEMESISLRRAVITDADKVRYRVYRSEDDFVAVIAENALLAVRVSGVETPHKIVRDIPDEDFAIEAQKMTHIEVPEQVTLPTHRVVEDVELKIDMPQIEKKESFVAMNVVALQRGAGKLARILPPDMLYDIIETHVRGALAATSPTATSPQPPTETSIQTEVQTDVAPPVMEAAVPDAEMAILSAPTIQSQEEIVSQLANEILPLSMNKAKVQVAETVKLSPDEVERLLNG